MTARAAVIAGLRCAPDISRVAYTARATPIPHVAAIPNGEIGDPAYFAAHTTPQPTLTMVNVPAASATNFWTMLGVFVASKFKSIELTAGAVPSHIDTFRDPYATPLAQVPAHAAAAIMRFIIFMRFIVFIVSFLRLGVANEG